MKKSTFTDSQIIAALKQAQAGQAVPALCRELCISSTRLRKRYVEEKIKAEIVSEALAKKC